MDKDSDMHSDSSLDSDVEMYSATSGRTHPATVAPTEDQDPDKTFGPDSFKPNVDTAPAAQVDTEPPIDATVDEEPPTSPSLDLLGRITGMYRLLDLINEQGSGGIVDKIIIAQESIARLSNHIHPGSYRSLTHVDFRALDQHTIKPLGVYGSIPALVDFLEDLGRIDPETRSLLLAPRSEDSAGSRPSLRPGLYLLDSSDVDSGLCHILFWPENTTWQDGTISSVARNRVTFMRYLTKLCDQLVCLISDQHSANLVWKDEQSYHSDEEDEPESVKAYDRLFTFSVEQTNEEEETAVAKEGFMLSHRSIEGPPADSAEHPQTVPAGILGSHLVVGEVAQAILNVQYLPEETKKVAVHETIRKVALEHKLRPDVTPTIELHDDIDRDSLEILLDHGLWSRCGDLQSRWRSQKLGIEDKIRDQKYAELSDGRKKINAQVNMLKSGFPYFLVRRAVQIFPILSQDELLAAILNKQKDDITDVDGPKVAEEVKSWFHENASFAQSKANEIEEQLHMLETLKGARYDTLKRRLRRVIGTLKGRDDLTNEKIQELVDLITSRQRNITEDFLRIVGSAPKGLLTGFVRSVFSTVSSSDRSNEKLPDLPFLDDKEFVATLDELVAERAVFSDAVEEIRSEVLAILERKISKLQDIPHYLGRQMQNQMDTDINNEYTKRLEHESTRTWTSLKESIKKELAARGRSDGPVLTIRKITRERTYYGPPSFFLSGAFSSPNKARMQYSLRQLEIKQDDLHESAKNSSHVCSPVIRGLPPPPFVIPLATKLRFIRLIGKDRCMVILDDGPYLKLYLDHINSIGHAIESDRSLKRIYHEKIGEDCLFALDETKRLFAMLSIESASVYLYIFIFDLDSKSINARGGKIDISRWYPVTPSFSQLVFLSGTEELLLVEPSGSSRIFSLVTENFRPSTLDLEGKVLTASSTPDGACLVLRVSVDGRPAIRCVHWASFGSSQGIEVAWPLSLNESIPMAVSSVGQRNITHILFLDPERKACQSLLLQITRKSSDFTFRREGKGNSIGGAKVTINNSLIDCHAEVWTRFPVHAAIRRETTESAVHYPRTISFVSSASTSSFSPYFLSMIREFEVKTRKPTRGLLKQIKVVGSPKWDPLDSSIKVSALQAGEWMMGIFCLIPIHLAITGSNRFIPLKDGVINPEFEKQLLGANVAQISEALSFGWYESIFSSYLAKKPVKVVTSMGEQSVGKSFALNHFVDTSFAGSAMRCTEGVWLSVTPTRDYIVVAIDFEGVHSIERSAQEDTLLVLLNAAISNFVLFRNNFAMSRDIAGLFTSFQSCSTVLDPASNPSLFNATLGIIIKDVIDSDTMEIVNEFQQKFQRIVQQERGDNFISKLHRGKLDIIPWPVIESSRFYELFGALKMRLDRQPLTHKHAGAFLGVLKMLMAKLKANDWGALDLNLAVQRSEHLSSLLPSVLSFGTTDPANGDPLRNFDTDEILESKDAKLVFYLEATKSSASIAYTIAECLKDLRRTYPDYRNRFKMAESDFIQGLKRYLQDAVDARIEHVTHWLKTNTDRFGEKAEITVLFRNFDTWAKEIKQSVAICGSKCSSCGLLCLEHKEHEGDHDCQTSHKCPHICSFTDQHDLSDIPDCGMPAGHEGRHVCSVKPHLCDSPCHLSSKDGCLRSCSKPMGHDDDEHICAAKVHACGEPCSLVKPDGKPICTRTCVIDCRRDHTQHSCDRSMSCPMKCELCNSFCAVADHFHPLEKDAVHLCGQRHVCRHKCQRPGICEIATTPQSIESTFVGKHATYQYTKFTQEARRLPCAVPLEPDQRKHEGPHVHSLESNFHYCEERCKHCSYYCTLPLGHPQKEHETSHGSMSQTEWVVEGDEDAVLELQGRKYATGDSGAPMLCSMLCKTLGRHVHIDTCRPDDEGKCIGAGIEHIKSRHGGKQHDWITHRLFWARSGFRDPYTNTEQADFDLCDHKCGGEEHDADVNPGAVASYCTLPLFHSPADPNNPPALGHVSQDGHAYNCKNPATMQRSFHIFFALDRSGSMTSSDRRPLPNTPSTLRIAQKADNRFGAVLSSLYQFWTARDTAVRTGAGTGVRRDAYTIIPFESNATVALSNDTTRNPDQLLDMILGQANYYGGTNFTLALKAIQQQMESTWTTERYPVVVFLSDGECHVADETVYDLCRAAVRLGKPLAFHAVSFGKDTYSQHLRRMAAIADEVYASAPKDPLAPPGSKPCTFTSALDTIQLATTFMSIANSLKNPRAALSRI